MADHRRPPLCISMCAAYGEEQGGVVTRLCPGVEALHELRTLCTSLPLPRAQQAGREEWNVFTKSFLSQCMTPRSPPLGKAFAAVATLQCKVSGYLRVATQSSSGCLVNSARHNIVSLSHPASLLHFGINFFAPCPLPSSFSSLFCLFMAMNVFLCP